MYIEGRYPTTEQDFRPLTDEELAQLKKIEEKTKVTEVKKISAAGLKDYIDEIVEILKSEEITTTRLTKN